MAGRNPMWQEKKETHSLDPGVGGRKSYVAEKKESTFIGCWKQVGGGVIEH